MLKPTEPGTRLAVGRSGAGKSYTIKQNVIAAARSEIPVLVIDPMHEWEDVPPELQGRVARRKTVATAAKMLDAKDATLVVVTPKSDVEGAVDEACAWALRPREGVRGVAVHEAWMAAPSAGRMAPSLELVIRTWRHNDIAAWFDVQRIASISRHVTELSTELWLFGASGDRDLSGIKEIGGNQLVDAVRKCAEKLPDEPGWHIVLGPARVPPYKPRRS